MPDTKNDDSRDVPLTSEGTAVVQAMHAALFCLSNQRAGYVFGPPDLPAEDGGFTLWQVQYHYRRAMGDAVKRHGIPRLTFHDLRHVAITRLRHFHVDALDLAKTTGHKAISVLARYDNEKPENRAALIRAREQAMRAATEEEAAAIVLAAQAKAAALVK
ncbi:tyrosine-type recombinase/integrase [Nguyenibacter vanlangensis]|uniref:Tyrosine-type recombinase/integrase n=1 Tax=Nguyenibacter vanlangensis TaxID=1216886 RepID=A0ABZ3DBS8_9PROT